VATSTERRRRLREIERRGWQLWALSLIITITLTLGIVLTLYPGLRQHIVLYAEEYEILPQLVLGLVMLVVLSAVYLVAKQYELNQMRNFIVATYAESAALRETCPADPLTGVLDRSALPEALQHETTRSERFHAPLCLVLFDIRGFTDLNQMQGNLAGDAVLKDLARSLLGVARQTDTLLRYGADEFLCFLPGTPREGGEAFIRRVRAALKQVTRLRTLVLDAGVAVYQEGGNAEAVLAEAEGQLSETKSAEVLTPLLQA
jgi:polar amino acid transport system substrate-binding protein